MKLNWASFRRAFILQGGPSFSYLALDIFISLFFKVDKVAPAIGLFPLSQFKVTCTLMKTRLIYYTKLARVPNISRAKSLL